MSSKKIHPDRIQTLNDRDVCDGEYTLYWMQHSQRAEFNHALEFAIQRANDNGQRLLVAFGLTENYPDANLRHYHFMLQGLRETAAALSRRKIAFCLRLGNPDEVAVELSKRAGEVICDRGYLRHHRRWRETLAKHAPCRVWQVETDAIVPVEKASDKREYAARTIRSKLQDAADEYLVDLTPTSLDKDSSALSVSGEDPSSFERLLDRMQIDQSVKPVAEWSGGTAQARSRLQSFIDEKICEYGDRTAVVDSNASLLSPYLHLGQISPVKVALEVNSWKGPRDAKDEFIEELLVRRELAINFVYYEKDYDSLKCLPDWAAETLQQHEADERPHHFTARELEQAKTEDVAWNACMTEMRCRGYLHNHLRMYWGKKIIEWTNTTDHAYRTALELNNKYFYDGRDANSYANVLWLFGLHDRAHQERDVFGKVRYMSAGGLDRKIDVDAYVESVNSRYPSDQA
ncbi:deoxyribodipyrimidine photolyase [Roseiconus nitratireducens]|uniref:Deoxyribodipyrimidine photo-lyase n=1 Tax=Roseiconus nitratireducens TaxID=2605748 RepID=A0A5M6D532_9BACT|nr:deoxyribodipyrimidine photo-lyase [Roseiconus nitratireducens]KAA5542627.1 deoxyribodipyrimidine photolyase [Roseiconus nitratireducens]